MKNKRNFLIIMICFIGLIVGATLLYNYLGDRFKTDSLVVPEQQETEDGDQTAQEETNEDEQTVQETPAADFTVTDREGNSVKLSDFEGKPVVLNFWASWCGPCKSEMPDFEEAYKEYEEDIHFLMVNLTDGSRETVEDADSYISSQGYTFPVYYDTESDAAITYNVYSVPTTYFIDAEGNLTAWAQGAIDRETLQKGIDMVFSE